MASNPAVASLLQCTRPVGRVAELGSLIWLDYVKQAVPLLSQKFHRFRFLLHRGFSESEAGTLFLRSSMLRYGSPLAAARAAREVIHLPRSDAAPFFHTRLKAPPRRVALNDPPRLCAWTGPCPCFRKSSRALSVISWSFFSFLKALGSQPFLGCGCTWRARAQTKPESSRATAAMTTGIFLRPTPLKCR